MYLYILFTLVESFCIIYSYNDIKNVTFIFVGLKFRGFIFKNEFVDI